MSDRRLAALDDLRDRERELVLLTGERSGGIAARRPAWEGQQIGLGVARCPRPCVPFERVRVVKDRRLTVRQLETLHAVARTGAFQRDGDWWVLRILARRRYVQQRGGIWRLTAKGSNYVRFGPAF